MSQHISDRVIEDYLHWRRATTTKSPLERLSSHEKEVLQLVVEGKSSVEIANVLRLSPKTIETYRSRQKLGVNDLPSLMKFAIHHGLTPLE